MAFPYIFESNFEQGSNAEWDSETDTGSKLAFPHYSDLARYNVTEVGPIAPYRGAYVAEWDLGDTNDHTLIEGDIDIADTVTRYLRFYLFLGKNLQATADDTFVIYEHQGTANAVESCIGLRITATTDAVEIGVGSTAPTVFGSSILEKGKWHCVELLTTVQTGGTGVSTLYLNGTEAATVTGVTNTAVLRGVLGSQDTLSTTTGYFFIDAFSFDDGRLYPFKQRASNPTKLTKSTHLFIGPGWLDTAQFLGAAGTCILYDTDTANSNDGNSVVQLDVSLAFNSFSGGAYFERGCYVELTAGTSANLQLTMQDADYRRFGPMTYGNVALTREYGLKRKARINNA